MSYTQCHLKRENASMTSWIPTEFAVLGKYIMLDEKASDDSSPTEITIHSDGWCVVGLGAEISDSVYDDFSSNDLIRLRGNHESMIKGNKEYARRWGKKMT